MELVSEYSGFHTERRTMFRGRKGESTGCLKLNIDVEGITTGEMTQQLETLATETIEKAKRIIAEQEAPRQFFKSETDFTVDEWIRLQKEHQQVADGTASESGL